MRAKSGIVMTVILTGLLVSLGVFALAQQVEEGKRARTVMREGQAVHVLAATLETSQWGWLDPKESPKLVVN